jgi:CheY-like chemotaxis protein
MSEKEILVIDDEPAIRKSLRRVLERAGYSVRTAVDGVDGLKKLEMRVADIVITDIIMPNVHGVDAIKAIVEKFPRVRIVAISGGGNFSSGVYQPHAIKTEAYLASAEIAGAHAVLTKPFRTADVLQAILSAVTAPASPRRPN